MATTSASGATGNLTDVLLRSARVLSDGSIAMAFCNPDGTNINSVLNSSITSSSANALVVGANGATNPQFNVDASVASVATGLNVKGAAAAGGVAVSVLSSGGNESLTVDAKGSGTVGINTTGTSAGLVTIGNSTALGGLAVNGPEAVTSASATALTVGPNGTTNPVLKVDASTASVASGINIRGNAAGFGAYISTISSNANEDIHLDPKGTGRIILGNQVANNNGTVVQSAASSSFTVGLTGQTNPAFQVDASTASQVAGLKVTGAATGGTVAVAAIDSGANTNVTVNAKGSGTINIGGTSTGQVSIGRGSVGPVVQSSTIASLGTTQNSTPTAAQIIGGVVTQTGATGAGTVTLPTGTQLSTAITGVAVGDTFQTVFANLGGGQTLTITGATGSTVIGTAAIGSAKNALLDFVNTGANTWNVYVTVSA